MRCARLALGFLVFGDLQCFLVNYTVFVGCM